MQEFRLKTGVYGVKSSLSKVERMATSQFDQ